MLKTLTLILIQSLFCLSCYSQTRTTSQIGIGTGYAYTALKNELISPYKYVGADAPLQLSYRLSNSRNLHHVQMLYASTNLITASDQIKTEQTQLYTQYGFHRKISEANKKFNIYAGFVFDNKLMRRQNSLEDGEMASSNQEALRISLSPSVFIDKSINRDQVGFQIWTVLSSYAFHNGYALSYPNEWSFLLPDQYLEINSRVSYNRYLSNRLDARLDYQFQYFNISRHETVKFLSHQLIVSLIYKLYRA